MNVSTLLSLLTILAIVIGTTSPAKAQPANGQARLKVMGSTAFETVESPVMKVFSAEQDGARFRAYAVEWKGQEVVILDLSGRSERSVGDTVRFMVQHSAGGEGGSGPQLRFILLDTPTSR